MDSHYIDDSDSSVEILFTRRCIRRISSSDDEDDQRAGFTYSDFAWKQKNRTPNVHNFSATSGVTANTQDLSRREVFELFFNDELVRKIISKTNKYGAADCAPITEDELKVFIALNILMSLIRKPTIQSYWSKDKSIETLYFKNVMSRNRFIYIATNLYFASNDISNDPLIKIQEVSDIIRKNFIRMYVPDKNISIDESLIQCRSRLRYIQFIRPKRERFSVKFCKLCDSKTRYIHNFKIYAGKEKTNSESASRNIIIDLLKESRLLYKGYCLFIGNWYNSPTLCRELYNMKTNVCGIARMNRRGMPWELKFVQLEKGEATVFSTANMAAIKWKDVKDVVLLTTMHSLDFAETEKTNRYNGEKIFKPSVVIDYYKNMGGIYVGDQILSKFRTMQRCKKACKKIFFYFIDMMLLNSYIIFKNNKKDRAFHVYKQKLAEEIIEKYLTNVKVRKTSFVNDSLTRYTGRHFPIRIPPTPAKGKRTSKRCVVCLSMLVRKETVFKCDVCDVALCIDHFKTYHVK